ncbi:MAG: putative zinc-binding protein [Thermoleophilia bacterium]|nr:putative zinc-binding protein [Thermoleophilia bacterium]
MAVRRICMHACGGITRVGATVARLATYAVAEELLPEKTLISCAPAFLRGVEEDVLMVLKSPSLALDGCEWSCGTNLLYLAGITPAVRFLLPEYAEAQGFDLGRGSRRFPSGVTQDFARVVAERVHGIARGMMQRGSPYQFHRPELKMQPEKWFRTAPNMEGIMEFVRLEPGIYRPVTMPELPEEVG